MTAQIPDTYRYKSKVYDIVAMTNPMGFDPKDYGLEPHSSCTACWRGYWCEYVIKYGKLIMERLLLYNTVKQLRLKKSARQRRQNTYMIDGDL